jgi:hypothetical protein
LGRGFDAGGLRQSDREDELAAEFDRNSIEDSTFSDFGPFAQLAQTDLATPGSRAEEATAGSSDTVVSTEADEGLGPRNLSGGGAGTTLGGDAFKIGEGEGARTFSTMQQEGVAKKFGQTLQERQQSLMMALAAGLNPDDEALALTDFDLQRFQREQRGQPSDFASVVRGLASGGPGYIPPDPRGAETSLAGESPLVIDARRGAEIAIETRRRADLGFTTAIKRINEEINTADSALRKAMTGRQQRDMERFIDQMVGGQRADAENIRARLQRRELVPLPDRRRLQRHDHFSEVLGRRYSEQDRLAFLRQQKREAVLGLQAHRRVPEPRSPDEAARNAENAERLQRAADVEQRLRRRLQAANAPLEELHGEDFRVQIENEVFDELVRTFGEERANNMTPDGAREFERKVNRRIDAERRRRQKQTGAAGIRRQLKRASATVDRGLEIEPVAASTDAQVQALAAQIQDEFPGLDLSAEEAVRDLLRELGGGR